MTRYEKTDREAHECPETGLVQIVRCEVDTFSGEAGWFCYACGRSHEPREPTDIVVGIHPVGDDEARERDESAREIEVVMGS